ncbi:hypothetical protein [Burkholderia territorii]|uniref:hypothetical protein n=1 Tax=Burkholderia territorii TaxID=1503055 RepID=UPI0012D8655D|nr:hypothetical protein [Burkholderia territorii]
MHRTRDRFHYLQRNNKEIVHQENRLQWSLNDLPIREYLVTKFSLIYRFAAAIPGNVADEGRTNADARLARRFGTPRCPARRGFPASGITIA